MDPEYAGLAQGYAAAEAQKDETFTRAVQERLKLLFSTVNEAHADLMMLSERMFGGGATQGGSSEKDVAPSSGRASDIMAVLDRLQSQAARVASQARSLNVRI